MKRAIIPFLSLAVLLMLLVPAAAVPATIHVPGDHPTIQQAISAAADGDSVLVGPGTYLENIYFQGKNLVLESSSGPEVTIIDGGMAGSVVSFVSGETSGAEIRGFTITNGNGTYIPSIAPYFFGGGILCSNLASPMISGNIIIANLLPYYSSFGGGIGVIEGASPIITDNVVSENYSEDGGGILFYEASGLVKGNTFTANLADGGYGGGIYCLDADPLIIGNRFEYNDARSGAGIAFVGEYADPLVRGNLFLDNRAASVGGAMRCDFSSEPLIVGNRFEGNFAQTGGAIYSQDSRPTIRDNLFLENRAVTLGGAIYHLRYRVEISGNRFIGNRGGKGGVLLSYLGTPVLDNNLITGNQASNYGGALALSESDLQMTNCTITGNVANGRGGAVYCNAGSGMTVSNSILWQNSAQEGPEIHNMGSTFITVDYTDISGGHDGTGNFDSDPLFALGLDGGFYLGQPASGQPEQSPCVDAGDPAGEMADGTTRTDEIPDTGIVDLGYHYPTLLRLPFLVASPGPGPTNPPLVRLFGAEEGAVHEVEFTAIACAGYSVRVCCGDLDGDDLPELIIGAGPGPAHGPHVRGFTLDGAPMPGLSFLAYNTAGFGVNVATGDLDGDGCDEIVTGVGPGPGFGPHVRGWNYDESSRLCSLPGVNYFAYGTNGSGVEVCCGDIDGDGFDEIVTAPGPGAFFGSHVRGWDVDGALATAIPEVSFMAYEYSRYGARVACGDLDGDGIDEIITAPGPGPANLPFIRGWNFDGDAITSLPGFIFTAWSSAGLHFGASVSSGVDIDHDSRDEIVLGYGPDPSAGPTIRVLRYETTGPRLLFSLLTFPEDWTHGAQPAVGQR
jgi:nitrous oxidase accessory protein NosD